VPSQRILFTSDLHSRRELYSELVRWADEVHAQWVVLGGDLFGGDLRAQAAFASGPCLETLHHLRETGVQGVCILPGNDDWSAALEALRPHASEGRLRWIAEAPVELGGGVNLLGYAYVPLTPLSVKDFEKLDHYRPDKLHVLEGIASGVGSANGGVHGVTRALDGSESIAKDLEALVPLVRPARTLFVSHCPPRNTHLDLAFGRHTGSQALRAFLERTRPALSLHGNVHPFETRADTFAEWVGETLAVNPGQGSRLHAVHFDAERPLETLVHTVLGPWRATPPARETAPPAPASDVR